MRKIVKKMIQIYRVEDLGYDMMGYTFDRLTDLSFHHLIISNQNGGPISFWNGAILVRKTSHDYLHSIEEIDRDMFMAITKELEAEKEARQIQIENLRRIRDILLTFEHDYEKVRTPHGKILIKKEYIDRRINL